MQIAKRYYGPYIPADYQRKKELIKRRIEKDHVFGSFNIDAEDLWCLEFANIGVSRRRAMYGYTLFQRLVALAMTTPLDRKALAPRSLGSRRMGWDEMAERVRCCPNTLKDYMDIFQRAGLLQFVSKAWGTFYQIFKFENFRTFVKKRMKPTWKELCDIDKQSTGGSPNDNNRVLDKQSLTDAALNAVRRNKSYTTRRLSPRQFDQKRMDMLEQLRRMTENPRS